MLEQYYSINEATGVSITVSQDGSTDINACSIAVHHNQLHFAKKMIGLHSIEEVMKHFPNKSLLALNFFGKGLLQKQMARTAEINQANFGTVLPNANIDDFYVQNFISGDQSFVSVIRKSEADKWIGYCKISGFVPLMLSLGPFPVQHVMAQVNVYGGDMKFDGHIVIRNEQLEWTAYNYDQTAFSQFPLKVESEDIDQKLLVAYSAAFQLALANKIEPIRAKVPSLEAALQSCVEGRKLKVQGFLILCGIFVLLLFNFFLFTSLNSSNAKLSQQVSRSAQSTGDIEKLNEEVHQKEALLKTLGWEGNINKSALIDQIASLLPQEITWQEAAIDPVDLSTSRNQKSIAFFYRKIRITGTAAKIIPVNEWIARITTKAWVKNVQLDSFTFNTALNTGQFIILIDY